MGAEIPLCIFPGIVVQTKCSHVFENTSFIVKCVMLNTYKYLLLLGACLLSHLAPLLGPLLQTASYGSSLQSHIPREL